MANDARKVSELGIAPGANANDRIVILTNPSTSPAVQTVAIGNIVGNFRLGNNAPAAANSSGTAGSIAYDSSYVYICIANNTWKRAALSTW